MASSILAETAALNPVSKYFEAFVHREEQNVIWDGEKIMPLFFLLFNGIK